MSAVPNQGPTGGLTPHLTICDARAAEAVAFYKAAFGCNWAIATPVVQP